jgi:hypothetical protein
MTNEPQLVRTYATPTAKALGLNVPQALHALASEKGEFISLLGAIIRRSCHSKFPPRTRFSHARFAGRVMSALRRFAPRPRIAVR